MASTQRTGTGISATFADSPFRTILDGVSSLLPGDQFGALDATLGAITLSLPSTADVVPGKGYWLMRVDSVLTNTVTIAPVGGQTINGQASASIILQYSSLYIVSDGSNWLLFASPASFSLSSDVLWTFPGTISLDQNANLYTLVATRAMGFVAVDVQFNVPPTGSDTIIDWAINGNVDPNLQITLPSGDMYAETVFAFGLAPGDTLQPIISQIGAVTPGLTMVMRARGQ